MKKPEDQKSEVRKIYKQRIDARGVPRKVIVDHLGEPGRFRVFGRGCKQGIHHFSC